MRLLVGIDFVARVQTSTPEHQGHDCGEGKEVRPVEWDYEGDSGSDKRQRLIEDRRLAPPWRRLVPQ